MTALLAASDAARRTASTASSGMPARRATSATARRSSPTPGGVPGKVTSSSGSAKEHLPTEVPKAQVANRRLDAERARPDMQDGPSRSFRRSDERWSAALRSGRRRRRGAVGERVVALEVQRVLRASGQADVRALLRARPLDGGLEVGQRRVGARGRLLERVRDRDDELLAELAAFGLQLALDHRVDRQRRRAVDEQLELAAAGAVVGRDGQVLGETERGAGG